MRDVMHGNMKNGKFAIICFCCCFSLQCEDSHWQQLFPFSTLRHADVTLCLRALCGRGGRSHGFLFPLPTHSEHSLRFRVLGAFMRKPCCLDILFACTCHAGAAGAAAGRQGSSSPGVQGRAAVALDITKRRHHRSTDQTDQPNPGE